MTLTLEQHFYATTEFREISRKGFAGYQTVAASAGIPRDWHPALEAGADLGQITASLGKTLAAEAQELMSFGFYPLNDDRVCVWRARLFANEPGCRPWSYFTHTLLIPVRDYVREMAANPFALLRSRAFADRPPEAHGREGSSLDPIRVEIPQETRGRRDLALRLFFDKLGRSRTTAAFRAIAEGARIILVSRAIQPAFLEGILLGLPLGTRKTFSLCSFRYTTKAAERYRVCLLHPGGEIQGREIPGECAIIDETRECEEPSASSSYARFLVDCVEGQRLQDVEELLETAELGGLHAPPDGLDTAARVMIAYRRWKEEGSVDSLGDAGASLVVVSRGPDGIRRGLSYCEMAAQEYLKRRQSDGIVRIVEALVLRGKALGDSPERGLVEEWIATSLNTLLQARHLLSFLETLGLLRGSPLRSDSKIEADFFASIGPLSTPSAGGRSADAELLDKAYGVASQLPRKGLACFQVVRAAAAGDFPGDPGEWSKRLTDLWGAFRGNRDSFEGVNELGFLRVASLLPERSVFRTTLVSLLKEVGGRELPPHLCSAVKEYHRRHRQCCEEDLPHCLRSLFGNRRARILRGWIRQLSPAMDRRGTRSLRASLRIRQTLKLGAASAACLGILIVAGYICFGYYCANMYKAAESVVTSANPEGDLQRLGEAVDRLEAIKVFLFIDSAAYWKTLRQARLDLAWGHAAKRKYREAAEALRGIGRTRGSAAPPEDGNRGVADVLDRLSEAVGAPLEEREKHLDQASSMIETWGDGGAEPSRVQALLFYERAVLGWLRESPDWPRITDDLLRAVPVAPPGAKTRWEMAAKLTGHLAKEDDEEVKYVRQILDDLSRAERSLHEGEEIIDLFCKTYREIAEVLRRKKDLDRARNCYGDLMRFASKWKKIGLSREAEKERVETTLDLGRTLLDPVGREEFFRGVVEEERGGDPPSLARYEEEYVLAFPDAAEELLRRREPTKAAEAYRKIPGFGGGKLAERLREKHPELLQKLQGLDALFRNLDRLAREKRWKDLSTEYFKLETTFGLDEDSVEGARTAVRMRVEEILATEQTDAREALGLLAEAEKSKILLPSTADEYRRKVESRASQKKEGPGIEKSEAPGEGKSSRSDGETPRGGEKKE